MPQMSPLWWLVFPMWMVVVVMILAISLFEMLMDKKEVLSVGSKDIVKMWW